jgi:hypothetical protein
MPDLQSQRPWAAASEKDECWNGATCTLLRSPTAVYSPRLHQTGSSRAFSPAERKSSDCSVRSCSQTNRESLLVKMIGTSQYHLWTDALHARALAIQADATGDVVDRGTYVRWTIITAWICFETACEDALDVRGLGYDFKRTLNESIKKLGLEPVDWGQGLWQQVAAVHSSRKDYIHVAMPQKELLADVDEADDAVSVLRDAIKDVYVRAGKSWPAWVEDDSDKGFSITAAPSMEAAGTTIKRGANPSDPHAIRIAYVLKGREVVDEICPPGTEVMPRFFDLLRRLQQPVSAVRAYRGEELICEWTLTMR